MPTRDSPEQSPDGPATDDEFADESVPDGDGAGESDESIEVEEASELAPPEIEADPFEETQEYLVEVAEASVREPSLAGDEVGALLTLVREEDGDVAEDVDLVLDQIGTSRPREFEVWSGDLADAADAADRDVALVATRSLAQLATARPGAAEVGLESAMAAASSTDGELRCAALSLVAEVGAERPDAVRGADPTVAAALRDDDPDVRLAGAIAAGKLLVAAPTSFPRTANALPDRLHDPDERVDRYAHVALAHVASERPAHLPAREEVLPALAAASDGELGLREGATGQAVASVLSHTSSE